MPIIQHNDTDHNSKKSCTMNLYIMCGTMLSAILRSVKYLWVWPPVCGYWVIFQFLHLI